MNNEQQRNWKSFTLKAFIWSIVASAAMGILALIGGNFGEFEIRVLLSTLTISGASLSALGGAAFWEKTHQRWPALPAMFFSALGGCGYLLAIWEVTPNDQTFWKSLFIITVMAVGASHGSLLRIAQLPDQYKLFKKIRSVLILLLTSLICLMILFEIDGEEVFRFMGILAILVTAATLATPVLAKLSRGVNQPQHFDTETLYCPRCAKPVNSSAGLDELSCTSCQIQFQISFKTS